MLTRINKLQRGGEKIYKNRKINNEGQITIFLCLIISVALIFFLSILEGVRVYMGRSRAEVSSSGAMYSIMADYNSELFKRYHLIVLDVDYGGRGEGYLEEKVIDYLEYNLNSPLDNGLYVYEIKDVFLVDYISLTDNKLGNFRRQIEDYTKTEGVIDVTQDLMKRVTESENDIEQSREDSWNPLNDTEDPREIIERIMDSGILAQVIPRDINVSTKSIVLEDLPSDNQNEYGDSHVLSDELDVSFNNINNINMDIYQTDVDSIFNKMGKENIEAIIYSVNCFANYSKQLTYDTVLEYELEYLIIGKDNDYDNLEAIVDRIMLHRYMVNYADIRTDEGKNGTALLLATALSIATSTEMAVDVYKEIVLAAWAYIDSLEDVKDIMSGDIVDNLTYEDYLIILFALSINKENQYYRMLDLMEVNIQQYEPEFKIKNCAYAIEVSGYMEFDSRLISNIDSQKYIYYFDKEISY